MRGKAKIPSRWEGVNGITPAYAGKRSQAISTGKRNRGSPPPMRGKGRVVDVMKNGERITPAYAGKSSDMPAGTPPEEDHPRLCGEKTKKIPKQRYFFHQPASFSFSLQYT